MKKIFLFLCLSMAFTARAQWINSLSIYPSNPGPTDSVYLIANCDFPSGSCDQFTTSFSISGNSISASALHCVGLLAYICNHVDSINLGVLPSGNYTATFQLDQGYGPLPCSPGIVPGPTATVNFTVALVTQTPSIPSDDPSLIVYPNPAQDKLFIQRNVSNETSLHIFNVLGETVYTSEWKEAENLKIVPTEAWPSGLYIVQQGSMQRKFSIIKQ